MTPPATTPAPPSAPPETGVVRVPGQATDVAVTGLATTGLVAVGALAVGAVAFGAVAFGALAVGRLAIGRLALRSGHARRLVIDDLTVVRLRVLAVERISQSR